MWWMLSAPESIRTLLNVYKGGSGVGNTGGGADGVSYSNKQSWPKATMTASGLAIIQTVLTTLRGQISHQPYEGCILAKLVLS